MSICNRQLQWTKALELFQEVPKIKHEKPYCTVKKTVMVWVLNTLETNRSQLMEEKKHFQTATFKGNMLVPWKVMDYSR